MAPTIRAVIQRVSKRLALRLIATIDFAREGDTLTVTKLDRLARSVAHLVARPHVRLR